MVIAESTRKLVGNLFELRTLEPKTSRVSPDQCEPLRRAPYERPDRANNGRSQCALRRTGMNDTMCRNQSQYCPFCGSFAKSPPSWQKKQGTPLRSNCFIHCRVKVMLLVLQSQGMGTIFSKPSR